MTKKEIVRTAVKTGANLAVSIGVGTIVGNAIAFTSPVIGIGMATRGAIAVGSFVLSNMISDKATEYTNEKLDNICDSVEKLRNDENVIDVESEVIDK